jgi:hypothetical protein
MQAAQTNSAVTIGAGFTFFEEDQALYRLNVNEHGEHVSTTYILYDQGKVAGEFTVTPDGRRKTSWIFDLTTERPVSRIEYARDGYSAMQITLFHQNSDNQIVETVITSGGEVLQRA